MRINKRFQSYIDGKNYWNRITNRGDIIEFPLTQKNVNSLANSLSSDLSPENLACDGEITPAAARAKGKKLGNVVKDLMNYCDKKGLVKPTIYY